MLSSNTAWVNDNIVHSAQLLLKELSKDEIKGWQSPQLCKTKALFSPLSPYSPFVQVLHVSQNHWITVSNMMQGGKISHDSVFVYDSLLPNVTKMDTKKQICSFLRPQSKTVRFELMNIQMQESLNDCGLHAIAIATELVYERDPCKAYFLAKEMRGHLIQCFNKKEITPFPVKRERRIGFGGRIRKSAQEKVYCDCRMPNYDKKMTMVSCNGCHEWYHLKCIGLDKVNFKMKWFCTACAEVLKNE